MGEMIERAQALIRRGDLRAAREVYEQLCQIDKDNAEAWMMRGAINGEFGNLTEAITCLRRAIALRPDFPQAYFNLGNVFSKQDNLSEALTSLEQAVALKPDYTEAYYNLGIIMRDQGRFEAAIENYRQALKLKPDFAQAHSTLGNALKDQGRLEQAIAEYHEAIRLEPDYALAHYNLGSALREQGRPAAAIRSYRQALTLKPEHADTHWNLSLAYLLAGDYANGWREYEWRFQALKTQQHHYGAPRWNAEPLAGKSILVWAEQGFGDALQFIRYLPRVKALGAEVVFACHEQLRRLLQDVAWIDRIVALGTAAGVQVDYQVPLLTLPELFATTVETIPAEVPYIHADPAWIAHWRGRVAETPGFTVGLVWAGNPGHKNDRYRSCVLDTLAPLGEVAGVTFYSLQVGPTGKYGNRPPDNMRCVDVTGELRDFADTAGLLANLDLVITVDTAVAHLAGAMGRPTWVLLPANPDWRWMLERTDCLWYPTLRLFRQRTLGDWAAVIEDVTAELAKITNQK